MDYCMLLTQLFLKLKIYTFSQISHVDAFISGLIKIVCVCVCVCVCTCSLVCVWMISCVHVNIIIIQKVHLLCPIELDHNHYMLQYNIRALYYKCNTHGIEVYIVFP